MINTVKIWDRYENKCFNIINTALERDELCFPSNYSVIFKKRKYFSKEREKNIVFDLAVEVTPKNSEKYQLLWIIECKTYANKKVPVDDIEEFNAKVKQISGLNIKGIMITDSWFSDWAFKYAKNNNIMLINTSDDDYSIMLYRTKKFYIEKINLENDIENFLMRAFYKPKITWLKKLSWDSIESIATKILKDYSNTYSKINTKDIIIYLEEKYKLKIDLNADLCSEFGDNIEWCFNISHNTIYIDRTISKTSKLSFILGHEIWHFFLHSKLKINNKVYWEFSDSTFSILEQKHQLISDKDWIEWQANKFSSAFFLQKNIFMERFINFRRDNLWISSPEYIYLDDQPCNISDYLKTLDYLSRYFNTTKLAIEFKIKELNLITKTQEENTLFSWVTKFNNM